MNGPLLRLDVKFIITWFLRYSQVLDLDLFSFLVHMNSMKHPRVSYTFPYQLSGQSDYKISRCWKYCLKLFKKWYFGQYSNSMGLIIVVSKALRYIQQWRPNLFMCCTWWVKTIVNSYNIKKSYENLEKIENFLWDWEFLSNFDGNLENSRLIF